VTIYQLLLLAVLYLLGDAIGVYLAPLLPHVSKAALGILGGAVSLSFFWLGPAIKRWASRRLRQDTREQDAGHEIGNTHTH
jgi:hypothetical protein